jgi:hypothetical protein
VRFQFSQPWAATLRQLFERHGSKYELYVDSHFVHCLQNDFVSGYATLAASQTLVEAFPSRAAAAIEAAAAAALALAKAEALQADTHNAGPNPQPAVATAPQPLLSWAATLAAGATVAVPTSPPTPASTTGTAAAAATTTPSTIARRHKMLAFRVRIHRWSFPGSHILLGILPTACTTLDAKTLHCGINYLDGCSISFVPNSTVGGDAEQQQQRGRIGFTNGPWEWTARKGQYQMPAMQIPEGSEVQLSYDFPAHRAMVEVFTPSSGPGGQVAPDAAPVKIFDFVLRADWTDGRPAVSLRHSGDQVAFVAAV